MLRLTLKRMYKNVHSCMYIQECTCRKLGSCKVVEKWESTDLLNSVEIQECFQSEHVFMMVTHDGREEIRQRICIQDYVKY